MALVGDNLKCRDHLVRKRAAIKSRLTSIKNFLEIQEVDPDVHAIKANMLRLETLFTPLGEYTCELQELEPNGNQHLEQEAMEDDYALLLTHSYKLQDKVAGISAPASIDPVETPRSSQNPFVSQQQTFTRLPEQALPKFNGKYEDWLSFQDYLQSTIGRRSGLSDTEKLKYLRSCLSGEPERLVKQFETTDEGYRSAWTLLKKMFEDKGRIRERHVSEILNIPVMQRESMQDLNELINTLELHNSALKSLAEGTYSTLMLCIALYKVDKATRKQWRIIQRADELPTYEKLIEFLRRIVIASDEPLVASRDERAIGQGKARNGSQQSQNGKGPKQIRSFVTAVANECASCKGQHYLSQCAEFMKLSPKERFQVASRASVCINCLRSGHSTKQCTSAFSCKNCHKRHHTMLHLSDSSPSTSETSENSQPKTSQS